MSELIYVVIGERGEYSEREEWLSRAFRSEAEAQAHADTLTRKLREYRGGDLDWLDDVTFERVEKAMKQLDDNFKMTWFGEARWRVESVWLS